jgi:hypothetical protein
MVASVGQRINTNIDDITATAITANMVFGLRKRSNNSRRRIGFWNKGILVTVVQRLKSDETG